MYTLPHQFEFLSDEWLAEAKTFLARRLGPGGERPGGPFSLSERFSDAPPHLRLPGGALAAGNGMPPVHPERLAQLASAARRHGQSARTTRGR